MRPSWAHLMVGISKAASPELSILSVALFSRNFGSRSSQARQAAWWLATADIRIISRGAVPTASHYTVRYLWKAHAMDRGRVCAGDISRSCPHFRRTARILIAQSIRPHVCRIGGIGEGPNAPNAVRPPRPCIGPRRALGKSSPASITLIAKPRGPRDVDLSGADAPAKNGIRGLPSPCFSMGSICSRYPSWVKLRPDHSRRAFDSFCCFAPRPCLLGAFAGRLAVDAHQFSSLFRKTRTRLERAAGIPL